MASVQLTVPKFGVSTEAVAISEWMKEIGEEIQAGDPVVLVETDKATVEIEATVSGTLAAQLAAVGTELSVGEPYAEVTPVGEAPATPAEAPSTGVAQEAPDPEASTLDAPAVESPAQQTSSTPEEVDVDVASTVPKPAPEPTSKAPAPPSSELPRVPASAPVTGEPRREPVPAPPVAPARPAATVRTKTRATPSARALAKSHGLDLEAVTGSGPEGRIRRGDVARHPGVASHEPPAMHATRGMWAYTVAAPMPALGGASEGATTLADLVVMAADLAIEATSGSRWQSVRLVEAASEVLLERRVFHGRHTPGTWEPVAPSALLEEDVDLTVLVSELPGLDVDIPALGPATMTVAAPADPGRPLTVALHFDPEAWDLSEAYGVVRKVGRLLGSPADLAGALWARSRE